MPFQLAEILCLVMGRKYYFGACTEIISKYNTLIYTVSKNAKQFMYVANWRKQLRVSWLGQRSDTTETHKTVIHIMHRQNGTDLYQPQ